MIKMAIKPTRYQLKKIQKGRLLNQRFAFKKEPIHEDDTLEFNYKVGKEFYDYEADKLKWSDERKIQKEEVTSDSPDIKIVTSQQIADALEVADKLNIIPSADEVESQNINDFSVDDLEKLNDKLDIVQEDAVQNGIREMLLRRYDDLVVELALIVSDRIRAFKKCNPLMAKLTGEDYGYIKEVSWQTGEATSFKYWPAAWRFERLIGTSVIFEARFHHTTFELVSYCTVFAYDPKTVLVRNMHDYDLNNTEDLQGIIAIYEKAIDFVNRKAKR